MQKYGHLRKPGETIDEFPYASTTQGGKAGPSRAISVPAIQNSRQGGYLAQLYRKAYFRAASKNRPCKFLVIPIDI